MYINSQNKLDEMCRELKSAKFICLDTEFLRERTFYAELCLIQLSVVRNQKIECYAIDPLVGLDIKPLLKILVGRKLVIIHAGRQDLEILYNLTGKLPKNVFDTQIAAMVCGFGEQASYANLVGGICKKQIDKSMQFTNWQHRPLSDRQIEYALDDVKYLPQIYAKLEHELKTKKRKKWLVEEEQDLIHIKSYKEDPANAWKKIKHKAKRFCDQNVLQALAAWRDTKAREVNKPRRFLVKDEAVIEIAIHKPKTSDDLRKLRNLGRIEFAHEVLEVVKNAADAKTKKEKPQKQKQEKPLDQGVIDLLKLLLKIRCAEENVAPSLVANSDDVEDFARGKKTPLRKGWRYEVFGKYAEELLEGKITFGIKNGKMFVK